MIAAGSRIVFIGTGEIGAPSLRALAASGRHGLPLVVTQPDKPAGRDMRLRPTPIKIVAEELGIPVFQPVKIRAAEAVARIAETKPDVLVVAAYGQILPKSVLEIPRLACLNLHASILPRHRGAAPIQAAILAGDEQTGVTVMYMDEGLDTGDIMQIESTPILASETGGELHDRLAEIAARALIPALDLLMAGSAPRTPQDSALATYARKLEKKDGWIDWTLPAEDIGRCIRAMNPWPGAFGVLDIDGKSLLLKIHATALADGVNAHPGTLIKASDGSMLVAAGSGALALREVQMEGRKRLPAADFFRGFSVPAGSRFSLELPEA